MTTQTHTVRRGETLSSIAKLYAVEVDTLAKANRMIAAHRISAYQTLTIPPLRNRFTPPATVPKPSAHPEAVKIVESDFLVSLDTALASGKRIAIEWMEELLQRLRTQEANENVQHEEKVPFTKQEHPFKIPPPNPALKPGSRSHRKLSDVNEELKKVLGKEPHIITFNGVKLTENEKKQIVASVAVCEMNSDGFGSVNADQEFVGRRFGKRGSEEKYSRILHIGLSYGMIQYTQDSGSLGLVLQRMQAKNPRKFVEILGGGDKEIAQTLINLTTSGRPDLIGDDGIPVSGQEHWSKISNTPEGKKIKKLSESDEDKNNKSDLPVEREVRGKRVQPIPPAKGGAAIDIWTGVWRERFLAAGKVVDFQEVQLDEAVEKYMNPILSRAHKNKVRSALGLAFVTACAIRGGVGSRFEKLIYKVAEELRINLPFESSEDERKCVDEVAHARVDGMHAYIGTFKFYAEESKRAKLLIKDELGFLAEDLYDTSSYF